MEQIEVNGPCGRMGSSLMLFLGGLGAGVALTILLAPRSGAATRRLIGSKVDDGKVWMKGQAAAAQAYMKVRGEEIRGRAGEVADVISRPLGSDTPRT